MDQILIVFIHVSATSTSPNLFSLDQKLKVSSITNYFGFTNWQTGGRVLNLVVATITPIPTITPKPECTSDMDLNKDGKINNTDYYCLTECMAYPIDSDTPACLADGYTCRNADFNHDNRVDYKDRSRLYYCTY